MCVTVAKSPISTAFHLEIVKVYLRDIGTRNENKNREKNWQTRAERQQYVCECKTLLYISNQWKNKEAFIFAASSAAPGEMLRTPVLLPNIFLRALGDSLLCEA